MTKRLYPPHVRRSPAKGPYKPAESPSKKPRQESPQVKTAVNEMEEQNEFTSSEEEEKSQAGESEGEDASSENSQNGDYIFEDEDALDKVKKGYRADDSIKEAITALNTWLAKMSATGATRLSNTQINEKALQYLQLSDDLHSRTLQYYRDSCTDENQAKEGASHHILEQGKKRVTDLNKWPQLKMRLAAVLRTLRSQGRSPTDFKEAGFRTDFPIDQHPGVLRQGLRELIAQEEANVVGDPIKEATLSLAKELNSLGKCIEPGTLAKRLEQYFISIEGLADDVTFMEEFVKVMGELPESNHERILLAVLKEKGLYSEAGITYNGAVKVTEVLESMHSKAVEATTQQSQLDAIWRKSTTKASPSKGAGKDGNNSSQRDKSQKSGKTPPTTKPECWVCGRTHGGDCGWIRHPCKGKRGTKWAASPMGKLQIEKGKAQTYKVGSTELKVLNPFWGHTPDHKDVVELDPKEVDNLKVKVGAKKSSEAKGKMAEMLLGVSEVDMSDTTSNPTSSVMGKGQSSIPSQENQLLRNSSMTQCRIFGHRDEENKLKSAFVPDAGSLSKVGSGNFISGKVLDSLINNFKIKVYKNDKDIELSLPSVSSGKTVVNDHVYFYLEYRSRSERNRVLRACVKAFVIKDLAVPIIIGKNDLLGNKWIESRHLHGFDPALAKVAGGDETFRLWLIDTYGRYDHEEDSTPIETMARHSKEVDVEQGVRDMLLSVSERLATEQEAQELFHLVDPDQRSEDEHDRYYEDAELDMDYDEGELPTELDGSKEGLAAMHKMLKNVKKVFSKALVMEPAKVPAYTIDIDEAEWEKVRQGNGCRPQSIPKQEAMKKYLTEYKNTLFQSSTARQASQVNMVPKPEPGTYRFTCDFRALNNCCRKIDFQLPKIWDILARIGRSGSTHFAKVDLTQGFHQVPLAEASRKLTAFRTYMGTYEYLRMAMGLKGAPQFFQKIIIDVLEDMRDICEVYIDDILIHARSERELIENTEKVLKRLEERGLTVNPRKTLIGLKKLEYLGLTLTQDRKIIVSAKRQEELGKFERPSKWRGLKSFLGIVNVFHKQVEDCANLSKRLNNLIGGYTRSKANYEIRWDEESLKAFETLKERIQAIPTTYLMSSGANFKTILRTDASDYGCGAHLLQREIIGTNNLGEEEYGEDRTIQFVSKSFDKTQLNWSTPEKECYGVWYACKKLQYLLEGETFEIEVDHKNLTILKDSINQKVQRWKNFLQRFDAMWRYIPGPKNVVADGLSRMRDAEDDETEDEVVIRDIILGLSEGWEADSQGEDVEGRVPRCITSEGDHDQGKNPVASSTDNHQERDVEEVGSLSTPEEEAEKSEQLKFLKLVIQKFHNKVEGHLGINKTMQCVETYFQDRPTDKESKIPYKVKYEAVKEFLASCPVCQKHDNDFKKLYTEPFVGSTYEPMECVQIDHIGPFKPDERGNTHILVMIDTFTRWVELYAVKDAGADTSAICLGDYILRYGPPQIVLSDNGSAFIDASFNAFAKMANVEITHPKAGDKERTGIVERENREVRKHLNNLMLENFMKENWSMAVKLVQRILNNTVHTTTGYAPAKLLYGRVIPSPDRVFQKPLDVEEKVYTEYMKDKVDLQAQIMKYIQEKMKRADKVNLEKRNDLTGSILEPEELVLYRRKIKTKAQLEFIGPFMVVEKDRDWYQLASLLKDKSLFWAHARNLKRFKQQDGVDPISIALMDDNEYEFEGVKEHTTLENAVKPNDPYAQSFGLTYKGFPNDVHWFEYREVKLERVVVEWCLKNKKWGWIHNDAKKIHKDLIDEDTKRQKEEKAAKAVEKEKRREMIKKNRSRKRAMPQSSEEKALESIRERKRSRI